EPVRKAVLLMFRQRLQQMFQHHVVPLKRSIITRLIITIIGIFILPTVAVTLFVMDISSQVLEDEVFNTIVSNMKWRCIYLDQQFDQLNSHIYSTLIHPDMSAYLADSEEESLSEQYDNQRKISNLITNVFYSAGNYMVGVDLYVHDRKKLYRYNSYEASV